MTELKTFSERRYSTMKCCICENNIDIHPGSDWDQGHNADPLASGHGRCCTTCNDTKVIPARLGQMLGQKTG